MNEGTNEPRSIEERRDDIYTSPISSPSTTRSRNTSTCSSSPPRCPLWTRRRRPTRTWSRAASRRSGWCWKTAAGAWGWQADSDTLIVRGVLQLLVQVVDGQPLEDVAQATIDFPARADLMATFNDARRKGVGSIIATIKAFAAAHAA